VTTELGDKVKYDVLNLIPPQRAGTIAVTADLVGAASCWCEVDHVTYESVSTEHPRDGDSSDRRRAEVGQRRERDGKDLRGRGREPAKRQAGSAMGPATPATAG